MALPGDYTSLQSHHKCMKVLANVWNCHSLNFCQSEDCEMISQCHLISLINPEADHPSIHLLAISFFFLLSDFLYTLITSKKIFFSIMVHHRILNIVPRAIQ